jgi:hypothetical protein
LWTGGITVDNTQETIQTLLFQNVEEKNMEFVEGFSSEKLLPLPTMV